MKITFILLFLGLFIISCGDNKEIKEKKRSHPSHKYTLVDENAYNLIYFETDYAPVYSDIYYEDGTRKFQLTTTLSIRNTSLTDSAFILSAIYYDSYGTELFDYIDSTILLTPLESIEFVVSEHEDVGGAGANFIIDWGASSYSNQVLIQSVMIGSYSQEGISFITEAKKINSKTLN